MAVSDKNDGVERNAARKKVSGEQRANHPCANHQRRNCQQYKWKRDDPGGFMRRLLMATHYAMTARRAVKHYKDHPEGIKRRYDYDGYQRKSCKDCTRQMHA